MARADNLIVGLDIGTTKICAIVGEVVDGEVQIIGIGSSPSKGLIKGVVINIESTVDAILKALNEAELMAGCEITRVFTGIAGGHIHSFNSHGIIAIKNGEVRRSDIARVVDAAGAVAIPPDREVIHILPQEFIVDEQGDIKEPLGMSGVRLEAKVHIVTGAISSAHNIVKCTQRSGITVSDIVLQQLASSESVLASDEKELGVALIDIGGGTTDLAIFADGSVKHTAVLPLGGNHVTSDIAVGLRTPIAEAERIKLKYGCCLSSMVRRDETMEVPGVGGRGPMLLPRQELVEIVEPRMEELFMLVQREIVRSGCDDQIVSGIVLTGGTSILEGAPELAENVFDLPVRRGTPTGIGGLVDVVNSPMYATGVGLVLYGHHFGGYRKGKSTRERVGYQFREAGGFARLLEKVSNFFHDFF
jgi:cell division protein FtsA